MSQPQKRAKSRVDIGLLWHSFQSANLGCGALSICNTAIVENAARRAGLDPVFHVFGTGDRTLSYYYSNAHFETVTNVNLKRLLTDRKELQEAMDRCDIFFDASAGDSFTDQYGWKRLLTMSDSKLMAAATGKPLILAPQTIGPFRSIYAKALARYVLNKCSLVFPRDELSQQELGRLRVTCRHSLSTDVAFRLPFIAASDAETSGERNLKIGLNVSALLYYGDNIPLGLSYRDLIDAIISFVCGDTVRAELHLVPHVLAHGHTYEDDMKASEELKSRFPQLILAPAFSNPIEAKSYMSNLDLVLASRMHAAIAALSADVPVLPLGYSRKFTGLFSGIHYPYLVDLTESNSIEGVIGVLGELIGELPKAKEQARKANFEAQGRLTVYQRFIEDWMQHFAQSALRQT